MRIHHALPILAALALAACGGEADAELEGEALSLEEAAGDAAGDDAIMPSPGQYRTTQELITFDMPAIPEAQQAAVRAAFAEGAAEPTSYCVSEDMTREQWLSGMAESRCTTSRFDVTGNNVEAVLACNAADGISGRVTLSGTSGRNGSDLTMTFSQAVPGMGDGTISMRVKATRTGNCPA